MSHPKSLSIDEIRKHNTKDSCYLIMNGKVYDCTGFLDEHPGGDEVLLQEAGQDATDAFEDVGHSDEARSLLPDMYIGDVDGSSSLKAKAGSAASKPAASPAVAGATKSSESGGLVSWVKGFF
ncbi:hypothetical protein BGX31_008368 [Mortierella sp. GBA43]|nr:hypothetical protein BGX31_008368 [Mortierella sp. GBA43]